MLLQQQHGQTQKLSYQIKSVKDKHHTIPPICGIFLKGYKRTYLQNRNRLTDFEKLMVTKGDRSGGGRDGLGFGTAMCALRSTERLANGELLQSTESYPVSCDDLPGKESERECMRVDV